MPAARRLPRRCPPAAAPQRRRRRLFSARPFGILLAESCLMRVVEGQVERRGQRVRALREAAAACLRGNARRSACAKKQCSRSPAAVRTLAPPRRLSTHVLAGAEGAPSQRTTPPATPTPAPPRGKEAGKQSHVTEGAIDVLRMPARGRAPQHRTTSPPVPAVSRSIRRHVCNMPANMPAFSRIMRPHTAAISPRSPLRRDEGGALDRAIAAAHTQPPAMADAPALRRSVL